MNETSYITIISKRKKIAININTILYIIMVGKNTEIHIQGGEKYETRMTLGKLADILGESFIRAHRGCIVSVMAIQNISDKIYLSNGEALEYAKRKKSEIINQLYSKQKHFINNLYKENNLKTKEDYHKYYSSFDNAPFAFTDIEMIFNEDKCAVDWIFKYANHALSKLEKVPLDMLIGNSFSSIFPNMDSKWTKSYTRSALYGETLEIMDYSPEIDKYLKIICFPTFKGHCGCILFDISEIKFTKNSADTDTTLKKYFGENISF